MKTAQWVQPYLKKVYGNGWSACKISWWSEEEEALQSFRFTFVFDQEWRIENLGQQETQIDMYQNIIEKFLLLTETSEVQHPK